MITSCAEREEERKRERESKNEKMGEWENGKMLLSEKRLVYIVFIGEEFLLVWVNISYGTVKREYTLESVEVFEEL